MNKPVIVWCVIAGVLLFAVIFRAIDRYYTEIQKPRHLFEMAKEKDIFYIPGDVEDDGFDEL